jgi:hypothetical protein
MAYFRNEFSLYGNKNVLNEVIIKTTGKIPV